MLCNQRKIDFNIIAEIVAYPMPHRHILCKAVAVAVADEFAHNACIYAVVDHCTAETKSYGLQAAAWSLRMASIDVQTQG